MKKDLLEEFPEAYNVLNFPYVAVREGDEAYYINTRNGMVRRIPVHQAFGTVIVDEEPVVTEVPVNRMDDPTVHSSVIHGEPFDVVEEFASIRREISFVYFLFLIIFVTCVGAWLLGGRL